VRVAGEVCRCRSQLRIGDTKFLLKKIGHAQIKTVVTNPATGASTPNTACAPISFDRGCVGSIARSLLMTGKPPHVS